MPSQIGEENTNNRICCKCNHINDETAIYCKKCGKELSPIYCDKCGQKLKVFKLKQHPIYITIVIVILLYFVTSLYFIITQYNFCNFLKNHLTAVTNFNFNNCVNDNKIINNLIDEFYCYCNTKLIHTAIRFYYNDNPINNDNFKLSFSDLVLTNYIKQREINPCSCNKNCNDNSCYKIIDNPGQKIDVYCTIHNKGYLNWLSP